MTYDLVITEIINGVYAGAGEYHGHKFHSVTNALSARDAEQKIKQNFFSWRFNASKKERVPGWQRGIDKLNIVWRQTNDLCPPQSSHDKNGNDGPRIYEVVKIEKENGVDSFEIRKHDRPLMTETEAKMFIFESTINGK